MRKIVLVDIGNGLTLSGVLPSVALYAAYNARLSARGGQAPYKYTVAGPLPAGMSLDAATGVLSAASVTEPGNFPVVIAVSDLSGTTVQRAYTIQVQPEPLTLSGAAPDGQVGTAYNFAYTINGGVPPYACSVTAGELPSGLSLSSQGVITGAPSAGGTSAWTVRVDDAAGGRFELDDEVVVTQPVDAVALAIWNKLVYGFPATEASGSAKYAAFPSGGYTADRIGTLTPVAPVTAQGDQALSTDGAYLSIPGAAGLSIAGDHTVMLWAKKAGTGTPGAYPKLLWLGNGGDFYGYANYMLSLANSTGKVTYRINTTDNVYHDAVSTGAIVNDTPTMILGRLVGNTMQLWINGALDSTAAIDPALIKAGANDVRIGSAPTGNTDAFSGSFASPSLFKPALTDAEIAYLWNGGAGLALTTLKQRAGVP